MKQIPVPEKIHAVIVHPHLQVSTKQARAILSRTVNMSDFVWQTANLAGFISGCYTNDLDLIKASLEDVVIEKQRQVLIPGFSDMRAAALEQWRAGMLDLRRRPHAVRAVPRERCRAVRDAMVRRSRSTTIETDKWIVSVQSGGAHVVSSE